MEVSDLVEKLIELNKLELANWVIVRALDIVFRIRYGIFAVEQVLPIFEEKYPEDNRPRKAIETVKSYIDNPTVTGKEATAEAALNASRASRCTFETHPAYLAYFVASAAVYPSTTADAADASAAYAATVSKELAIKIIRNGINILDIKDCNKHGSWYIKRLIWHCNLT